MDLFQSNNDIKRKQLTKPRGPIFGARADAAPISPPMALSTTYLGGSFAAGGGPILYDFFVFIDDLGEPILHPKPFCKGTTCKNIDQNSDSEHIQNLGNRKIAHQVC
jgi:hypothetical protein